MRHLLLLLALPLLACPSSGVVSTDDDDATTDDDDAADDDDATADDDDATADDDDSTLEAPGCWFDGPGSDRPFAWGQRGTAVVLLAPDGSETVLHDGDAAGPILDWTLLQAGEWMAAIGRWNVSAEDRGTVAALFDGDGALVGEATTPGGSAWSSYLAPDGQLLLHAGSDATGAGASRLLRPDGQIDELPFGTPAGPPQLGAVPLCQYENDVCGWLPDDGDELLQTLDSSAGFWPGGEYLLRFDQRDLELPALQAESPWYPLTVFLQDLIGPDDPYASIVATAPGARAVLGHLGEWETARWVVAEVSAGEAFELDLGGRGVAVDGGICESSPPTWQPDGSLVYVIRDDTAGTFVRRDPDTGTEEPMGQPITGFLFAESLARDGAWALSTGDGSDTFCGESAWAWPDILAGLHGNSIQLLRPDDGVAHALEANPLASGYGLTVGLARGGWCASVPDSTEWGAELETFDLGTGERAAFPQGFAFGGWLD